MLKRVLALGIAVPPTPGAPPRPETLDRGLVVVATAEGNFLSWRLLRPGENFTVRRDGRPIATVTGSTNLLDRDGTAASSYQIDRGRKVTPWTAGHYDLPLQKPADGPGHTYSANDMSVGDVDGDGQYEYVVKWDPSNSKDVSQVGYTGKVFIDTYELDGTLRHRIDLGVNIRAGAHYTQFLVYDFDGDGRAEIMMKTAPGTSDGRGRFVTMPRADVRAGYRHTDDYRLSAAGYREHLIEMFRGWDRHPEVVAGRWPRTLEEAFGIEQRNLDAAALADYFIDVYAPSRSARNNLRAFEGFILDGPEYLTVFAGDTGRELQTIHYRPGRHDDGLMWGDYAMPRIEPGNRVDRFLAGVAYLDGRHPSAVFARGYYTRSTLVAYRWNGRRLVQNWYVDSGWTPMTNPFNDTPHGRDGTSPSFKKLTTQGFHSMSAADVDGDGRQEIVYGAATIDDDGSLLYSSFGTMPDGTTRARLGHGDAMHVADIDPDRPGLEIFTVHEGGPAAPYGMAMRDAATGELLFGTYSGADTGRGMIGDVSPSTRGLESWASMPSGSPALGVHTAKGQVIPGPIPGTNMSIRWSADKTTQIVNGALDVTPTIDDRQRGRLLTATGTLTNNGTKGNPSLVADVLGDWREELFLRTTDSSAIRVYVSTELTTHKLVTLMRDPQYRVEVARQQTAYNQPSYVSSYFGSS